ncbi:MAG: hypothetical protein AB1689_15980 [Thermodesulfobacteriota bacterium]
MSPDDTRDEGSVGCGHAACLCAAGESGYCSAFCEQAGDAIDEDEGAIEGVCGCGHADCAAA